MTECIAQEDLPFHPKLPVVIRFDAPDISSDGGVLLLREVDERLGLTAAMAACLPDERDPTRVVHSRPEQVRQRTFQIALGYEDCNDADSLRLDPLLKTACDRTPKDPIDLSSQPTLSRLENAPDGRALGRLFRVLERTYVASLRPETQEIILDIDATDDATHGQQQLSFFNAYFDHHIYHPLLIFDGDGQLITALLRPGNVHASRGAKGLLRRLIRKIRKRCPEALIVVRGDSGFCVPRILNEFERLDQHLGGIDYLLGIPKNAVLLRHLEPEMELAKELHEKRVEKVVRYTSFSYAAKSWPHSRHVVGKAEYSFSGRNPRFVVTSLCEFPPDVLYQAYCRRGQCENRIKDLKNALIADRLSCSSFKANFFRLLLHAAAYRLMFALRQALAPFSKTLHKAQFDTLRLRLLKVAAEVTESTRRILVRLPKAFPFAEVFCQLARQLAAPAHPT
jgi:hypothetical protein